MPKASIRDRLLAASTTTLGRIKRLVHNPQRFKCSDVSCERRFRSMSALKTHESNIHHEARYVIEPDDCRQRTYHPHCTGLCFQSDITFII
jgi:hypothetical protein